MRFELDDIVYEEKKNELLADLESENIEALCLFNPTYIKRLTGFPFTPTERPIVYVLDQESESVVIPSLEKEHIEVRDIEFDEVVTYPDYPGENHPMKYIKDMIDKKDYNTIAVDQNGYSSGYGYFGPSLSELVDAEIKNICFKLEKFFSVKHDQEIELLKESAKWENLGMSYLQEETKLGLSEIEISMNASLKASNAFIRTLGQKFEQSGEFPISAAFHGQVGKDTALPHAIATNKTIKEGDVLINYSHSEIGGYHSELERTWIVGEPTKKQRKYFNLAVKAQDTAFDKIEAGVKLSEIDKAVKKMYEKEGIKDTWRHHTGHGIGTRIHEPPFIDVGEDIRLKKNMVFSIEPGIYVKDYAGFRHSDTIVVKKNGLERLTYYPRDLENNIINI